MTIKIVDYIPINRWSSCLTTTNLDLKKSRLDFFKDCESEHQGPLTFGIWIGDDTRKRYQKQGNLNKDLKRYSLLPSEIFGRIKIFKGVVDTTTEFVYARYDFSRDVQVVQYRRRLKGNNGVEYTGTFLEEERTGDSILKLRDLIKNVPDIKVTKKRNRKTREPLSFDEFVDSIEESLGPNYDDKGPEDEEESEGIITTEEISDDDLASLLD